MLFGLGDILRRLDSAIDQAHKMACLFPFDPDDPVHQKVLKLIHKIIEKLQKSEVELKGREGLLKLVSTEEGEVYLKI